MRVRLALFGAVLGLCLAPILSAQDAAKVDPKHYTVVSENDQVRILKVHYGAHEKSVMHSHPEGVAVFLTDAKVHFLFRTGKPKPHPQAATRDTLRPASTCRKTRETGRWI